MVLQDSLRFYLFIDQSTTPTHGQYSCDRFRTYYLIVNVVVFYFSFVQYRLQSWSMLALFFSWCLEAFKFLGMGWEVSAYTAQRHCVASKFSLLVENMWINISRNMLNWNMSCPGVFWLIPHSDCIFQHQNEPNNDVYLIQDLRGLMQILFFSGFLSAHTAQQINRKGEVGNSSVSLLQRPQHICH